MGIHKGMVAAGHEITASAAVEILKLGGNAFDAALAGLFASCVAEPVLASLGGGGFLLAHQAQGATRLYDFFVQTPRQKFAETQIDFYPVMVDFGTAQQEFHIGMGSIAVPGMVKGLFAIHRDLCRLPLKEIIGPAVEAAKEGVPVNALQFYIADIISPIIKSSPASLRLHESPTNPGEIAAQQERVPQQEMADAFDALAREGEALFYQGEMGQTLVRSCQETGGYLRLSDLHNYSVAIREPLNFKYRNADLFTNPAPSVGGTLIAFTLSLLEREDVGRFGHQSYPHLLRVSRAMQLTQQLRQEKGVDRNLDVTTSREVLSEPYLESYRKTLSQHPGFSRGTTQISIADKEGNLASMTLSNGEGSGYVLPGTGIMLNNMLGEEDINPHGFHNWPEDRRIASMMSPTLVLTREGGSVVTGSGGSNRIRSAILQVLINLLDFEMEIDQAVESPRLHFEEDLLNIELGTSTDVVRQLETSYPDFREWPGKNLFFGGAHSVVREANGTLKGKGDSRRGGISLIA